MKKENQIGGGEPMKPDLIKTTYRRPASFKMRVLCAHLRLRQVPLDLEQALVAATTLWHKACSSPLRTRSGPLKTCLRVFNNSSSSLGN